MIMKEIPKVRYAVIGGSGAGSFVTYAAKPSLPRHSRRRTFLPYSLATPDFRAASATALATAGPTLGSKAAGMM